MDVWTIANDRMGAFYPQSFCTLHLPEADRTFFRRVADNFEGTLIVLVSESVFLGILCLFRAGMNLESNKWRNVFQQREGRLGALSPIGQSNSRSTPHIPLTRMNGPAVVG